MEKHIRSHLYAHLQMGMAMRCWNIRIHAESEPKVRTPHIIQLQHVANARRRMKSPNCGPGIGILV